MSRLDLLVPFAIPPAEMSRDLLRELNMPAFARMLSRAKACNQVATSKAPEEFQRTLPHENWLARAFGIEGCGSPQVAPDLMAFFGLQAQSGTWFVLQPVHIHVARDHLVLTDQRELDICDVEAEALFRIAHDCFAEAGKTLLYGNATTWFVRADDWSKLQTSTPDVACGRNIDIWMPTGPGERSWRKVQNEVQMLWFNHPINVDREAQGKRTINSLWLWGGGSPGPRPNPVYTETFNFNDWMLAFSTRVQHRRSADSAAVALSTSPRHGIACLDMLLEPALANDWGRWLSEMHALETNWFAPLLDALKTGTLSDMSIFVSDDARFVQFAVTRSSLRKFWVSPSLAPLARLAS